MPSEAVIDKWLGEPIKAAILPTSIFLTNKKGFPVLSKAHQRIIFRLFKVGRREIKSTIYAVNSICVTLADKNASFCIVGGTVCLHWHQSAHRKRLQILPAVPRIPQPEPATTQCLWGVCKGLWRLPAVPSSSKSQYKTLSTHSSSTNVRLVILCRDTFLFGVYLE